MVLGHFEWARKILDFSLFPGLYLCDILTLGLTIPPQFGIGRLFFRPALKSLRHGTATMDVLVTFSTLSAFFFSCFAMLPSHTTKNLLRYIDHAPLLRLPRTIP